MAAFRVMSASLPRQLLVLHKSSSLARTSPRCIPALTLSARPYMSPKSGASPQGDLATAAEKSSSAAPETAPGKVPLREKAKDHPLKPPMAPAPPKRVTIQNLHKWREKGRPIVMVTAYDYPGAVQADLAEIDIILVGDSVGMVELGHETTQFVTIDQMIHHCKAVMQGAKRPFVVGDLPFGSYEVSPTQAVTTAFRVVKEAHVNAVKLEGGKRSAAAVRAIHEAGIAVMGHVGLTPASVSALGGFRSFGKTSKEAMAVLEDALAIQEAGAFAVVLECLPERVARLITETLDIPTIGIGAGRWTSGQVLVMHDLLGMLQHPQHAKVTPKFCKRYADVGLVVQRALEDYRDDVRSRGFPSEQYSPYAIPDGDYEAFEKEAGKAGLLRKSRKAHVHDEEHIKLY